MPSSCAGQASELLTPLPATLLARMRTSWARAWSAGMSIAPLRNPPIRSSLAIEIMCPSVWRDLRNVWMHDGIPPTEYPIHGNVLLKSFNSQNSSQGDLMAWPRFVPISFPNNNRTERGNATASTQARRLHAPGLYSHRRLALSRRLAGRQFQFCAHQTTDPQARGWQVRCVLHGRSPGGAEHAGRCLEAQPYGDFVRTVHAALGALCGDRTYRADRDRFDHF